MKTFNYDIEHVADVWEKQGFGSCEKLSKELGCSTVTAAAYIKKVLDKQKKDGKFSNN